MYKAFLADDERIIREGISRLIDWEALGIEFAGTAEDGETAYDRIVECCPDIVITDIKMPGMDGIQLIERLTREAPHIVWIVLSGYGEFEYASKAMKYGVKHYLLKPSDEREIASTLTQVVNELNNRQSSDRLFQRALPKLKEEFLRDCLHNRVYSKQEWEHYRQFFELQGGSIKLVLFEMTGSFDDMHVFALSNITDDILGESAVLASTLIGNSFVALIRASDHSELISKCTMIQETFSKYYKINVDYQITNEDRIEHIPDLYKYAKSAKEQMRRYSPTIQSMIEAIQRNLSNEALTLHWLANEILYMNPSYLGKLFKKETDEMFHQFVTRLRIERAKELLKSDVEYKIYEIAERSGFGVNAQYFSQVFKKFTGSTPKEFSRKMKNREAI